MTCPTQGILGKNRGGKEVARSVGDTREVTVETVHCSELGGRQYEGEGLAGPKAKPPGPHCKGGFSPGAVESHSLGLVQTGPRGLLKSLWLYAADGWWQRDGEAQEV